VRPLTQKWARQGKAALPCQFFLAKKVMYGTQACAYHTLLGYLLQSSQSSFDFTMLACSAYPRRPGRGLVRAFRSAAPAGHAPG